jgi:hypothetical protein
LHHETEIKAAGVYKKGTDNGNSDGLSRMYTGAEECVVGNEQGDRKEEYERVTGETSGNSKRENKNKIVRVVAESENISAEEISGLVENMRGNEDRINEAERGNNESEENQVEADSSRTRNIKLSDREKLEILKEMHESPIGGHTGMNRTYQRLKKYITWEGIQNDIEEFIRKCENCQENKLTQRHTKMPLTVTDTPAVVSEKCSVDIIGTISVSESGNRYYLTVQDNLSKFLIAVPMKKQTVDEVARAFVENVILVYGLPQVVYLTGANFLSDTFVGICKLLGIKKTKTTPFHPESN